VASVLENQVTSSHAAAEDAAAELNALIRTGKEAGASDIHLQPDLPTAFRVSSGLVASKKHMSRDETLAIRASVAGAAANDRMMRVSVPAGLFARRVLSGNHQGCLS
jgi:hypothetical protein